MPQPSQPSFGALVRHYRISYGWTIEQLAKRTHLTFEAIETIERETQLLPPYEIVDRLADVFDLSRQEMKNFHAIGQRQLAESPPAMTAAPVLISQIFVFLIADVRGYTHFTQEHGDVAAARLASRFATIAREEIARWEGRVIELRGDEVLAIFGSARQALQAAVELQLRYAEATAHDPMLPLAVGIGVDAGEAVPVENGYRGAALNLAARLCSLAGPGETLTSDGVIHLARRVDELTYTDRGQAQLKGFDDPMHVIQVTKSLFQLGQTLE